MAKRKTFSVRFGPDVSVLIIEIVDFEEVTKPASRTALHRSVESHIQRGKAFIKNLKEVQHDASERQA